eukprot:gene18307-biopygen18892
MGEPVPNEARQHGRPDTTDCMPKLLDLYGDKTHTTLCKKANSSMKFEQMVLEPALAYFHDAIVYEEDTVDLLQDLPESEQTPFLDELWDRMLRGHTTKKGIYGMLCNRYTMMGRTAARTPQRARRASRTVATIELMEADEEARHLLNTPRVKRRTIQEYVRCRKGAWRAGGESSEALQWIARGAKMRWVKGPPPTFDHESSLRDRTPQQQEWLDIETDRVVRSGAWGDWCFSFDLKDVYHAVEIDPEFQKFIQFDIQGV